jgi:hypothetical protein
VRRFRTAIAVLAAMAFTGGCATVSVYEPSTSAEISLTPQQSRLHKAAEDYSRQTREKGLATGETSLGSLAAMLTGQGEKTSLYWTKIGGDRLAPQQAAGRIRADAGQTAAGLSQLDTLARSMMAKTQPARDDVTQFERALIHATQARDNLAEALGLLGLRSGSTYEATTELAALDKAIASARTTADDLAAARIEPAVALAPTKPNS